MKSKFRFLHGMLINEEEDLFSGQCEKPKRYITPIYELKTEEIEGIYRIMQNFVNSPEQCRDDLFNSISALNEIVLLANNRLISSHFDSINNIFLQVLETIVSIQNVELLLVFMSILPVITRENIRCIPKSTLIILEEELYCDNNYLDVLLQIYYQLFANGNTNINITKLLNISIELLDSKFYKLATLIVTMILNQFPTKDLIQNVFKKLLLKDISYASYFVSSLEMKEEILDQDTVKIIMSFQNTKKASFISLINAFLKSKSNDIFMLYENGVLQKLTSMFCNGIHIDNQIAILVRKFLDRIPESWIMISETIFDLLENGSFNIRVCSCLIYITFVNIIPDENIEDIITVERLKTVSNLVNTNNFIMTQQILEVLLQITNSSKFDILEQLFCNISFIEDLNELSSSTNKKISEYSSMILMKIDEHINSF